MTPDEADQFLAATGFQRPWTAPIEIAAWQNVLSGWEMVDAVSHARDVIESTPPRDVGPHLFNRGLEQSGDVDAFIAKALKAFRNANRVRDQVKAGDPSGWTKREFAVLGTLNWLEVPKWNERDLRFNLRSGWKGVGAGAGSAGPGVETGRVEIAPTGDRL